jgi:3-demethoxyubiquinol 3-hydroxylase
MTQSQTIPLRARPPRPEAPGLDSRARRLREMIRVDHAGEYGAVQIYRGQRAVFERLPHKARIASQLAEMEREEGAHLAAFDKLIADRGVRPTIMAPLWNVAGFALGAATALMGEKAAHAATVAVEEVIADHYADQIDEAATIDPAFSKMISGFRDEEIGHRDLAESEGAREMPGYGVFSAIVKFGCRVAIKVSEKV